MIGNLSNIAYNLKTLLDRWTSTLASRVDANITSRADGSIWTSTVANRINVGVNTRLRAPTRTVYTSGTAQTYNLRDSANNNLCYIILVGGGGGGGGYGSSYAGGSGGGGATWEGWMHFFANPTYTVGVGGSGGGPSGPNGGSGSSGTNTFLGTAIAPGGHGGSSGSSVSNSVGGDGGGAAFKYDDAGSPDYQAWAWLAVQDANLCCGGAGGGSVSGKGQLAGFPFPDAGPNNGVNYSGGNTRYGVGASPGGSPSGYGGGGARPAAINNTGSAGGNGLIVIYDYGDITSGN